MSVVQRYQQWLDFTAAHLAAPMTAFPRREVQRQLTETFDCLASWNWEDAGGSSGFELLHPISGWPTPEEDAVWRATGRDRHPLVCWFRTTLDPRPMTIGRVPAALCPPGGLEVIRETCGRVGLDQQLSIPYQLGPGGHRAFVLAQHREDFPAEDLDLARRIQPLIEILARTARETRPPTDPVDRRLPDPCLGLTARELVVLQQLADGGTALAIAHRLGVSPRTVHTHLEHVYRKLGVRDRMRAVLVAQELGLVVVDRRTPRSLPGGELSAAVAAVAAAAPAHSA